MIEFDINIIYFDFQFKLLINNQSQNLIIMIIYLYVIGDEVKPIVIVVS